MEEIEHVIQMVKATALTLGECCPTLHVYGSEGNVIKNLREEFPSDHEMGVATLFRLGASLRSKESVGRLERVYFAVEGWVFKYSTRSPRRIKVLIVAKLDVATKYQKERVFGLVHNKTGRLVGIRDKHLVQDDLFAKLLVEAFANGYTSME